MTILDKGPELLIIEVECSFIEALNLARRFRLCAYTGFILLISTTKERDKQIEEKICAIDSGVDEYLGHRQTNEEIIASVKALLRRFQWKADLELRISGRNFLVNPQSRKISLDNKECIFTRTEFAILNYLIWNLNRAVSYKELYEAVWEKEYLHDDMNIMAHIHRIRKKMGMIPKILYTYRMYMEPDIWWKENKGDTETDKRLSKKHKNCHICHRHVWQFLHRMMFVFYT